MKGVRGQKQLDRQEKPARILAVSFLSLILAGTLLLSLPFASVRTPLKPVDALFTATSAVCVTGLIVKDTSADFSRAGQLIILVLIQIGGLGLMTFSLFFAFLLSGRLGLRDRMLIEQSFTESGFVKFSGFLRTILLYTFSVELIGAVLLYTGFGGQDFSFGDRIFQAVFHSVSAFCNAGFSVLPDNLMRFTDHSGVNVVVMLLIISGGLGFFVVYEIWRKFTRKQKHRLSLHTKSVIWGSLGLIFLGFLVFMITEPVSGFSELLSRLFLSVTARTAGFNTLDTGTLSHSTLSFLCVLMFIGGSPGSTAGGIKVTTVVLLFFFLVSRLRGRQDTEFFGRRIPFETMNKAMLIFLLGLVLLGLIVFLMTILENSRYYLIDYIFESVSAFGTVGLSTGVTPELSNAGKLLLCLTMFIGRVGPLTLVMALSQFNYGKQYYRFPEEEINVG